MNYGISLSLVVLLASVNVLVASAIDMYLPAFPAIANELSINSAQVQQTLSVFLIGLAVGQGIYGPLLDRFGRRTPLLCGVALFVLGSVLAALAESLTALLLARFIQAVGAAAGSTTPRAIIADICDTQSAARAFSMLMQLTLIAPIGAPLLGGALLLVGNWTLIFWVLAGVAVLSGLAALRLLPETLPVHKRIPISARSIIRNYAKLLENWNFLRFTLASCCTISALFIYISNSPFIFIQRFNLTPNHFSFIFAASAMSLIFTGQINLFLLKRLKPEHVLRIGLCFFIAAASALALLSALHLEQAWSYALLLGSCLSMLGLIGGNLTALCMQQAGNTAGIASSLMGVLQLFVAGLVSFLVNITPMSLFVLPLILLSLGVLATVLSCLPDTKKPELNTTQSSGF